jgi:hypothetical protein
MCGAGGAFRHVVHWLTRPSASGRQVPLAEDLGVMGDVPHCKIRQGPHRERIVACDAPPHPCLRWQGAKEGHRRRSNGPELLHETSPGAVIRPRGGHRDRPLETGQGALKTAGKPEGAKHKEALGVAEVVHDVPDAPLAGRIATERRLLSDAEQQVEHVVSLRIEQPANVEKSAEPATEAYRQARGLSNAIAPRLRKDKAPRSFESWLLPHLGLELHPLDIPTTGSEGAVWGHVGAFALLSEQRSNGARVTQSGASYAGLVACVLTRTAVIWSVG